MKKATQLILLAALATAGSAAVAQTNVAAFASPKDKASYAIGIFFGNQLKNSNMDVDTDIMLASIKDMLAGRPAKLDQNQAREAIMAYQAEAKIKLGKKNQLQGDAFLESPRLITPQDVLAHLATHPGFPALSATSLPDIESTVLATPDAVRLALLFQKSDPCELTPEPMYLKPPHITTPRTAPIAS
jgi:hypothetical protein